MFWNLTSLIENEVFLYSLLPYFLSYWKELLFIYGYLFWIMVSSGICSNCLAKLSQWSGFWLIMFIKVFCFPKQIIFCRYRSLFIQIHFLPSDILQSTFSISRICRSIDKEHNRERKSTFTQVPWMILICKNFDYITSRIIDQCYWVCRNMAIILIQQFCSNAMYCNSIIDYISLVFQYWSGCIYIWHHAINHPRNPFKWLESRGRSNEIQKQHYLDETRFPLW